MGRSWLSPSIFAVTSFVLVIASSGCSGRAPVQEQKLPPHKLQGKVALPAAKAPSEIVGEEPPNLSQSIPEEIAPPRNESEARSRFTEATGLTLPTSAKIQSFGGHHWPPDFHVVLQVESQDLSEWARNPPPWHHGDWKCGPVDIEIALAAAGWCMKEIQYTEYPDGACLYMGTGEEIVEILNQKNLRFAGQYENGRRGRLLVIDVSAGRAWLTVWEE